MAIVKTYAHPVQGPLNKRIETPVRKCMNTANRRNLISEYVLGKSHYRYTAIFPEFFCKTWTFEGLFQVHILIHIHKLDNFTAHKFHDIILVHRLALAKEIMCREIYYTYFHYCTCYIALFVFKFVQYPVSMIFEHSM